MSKETSLENKAKELIGRLTTFLSKDEKPAEVKLEAEATKKDGTVIYTEADSFDVGATVFVKEGEGYAPAPDGEHQLEDGSVVVVAEGVVAEVKEEAPEEEMQEEHSFVTHEQFESKLTEFASLIADAIGLSKDMAEQAELSKEKVAELETSLSKIKEENEALETRLSETPAEKSVKKEKPKAIVQKLSAKEWANASVKFRIQNPELNPHNK
jgi:septal ring factor EnvC (AmiA/AmiB activator)